MTPMRRSTILAVASLALAVLGGVGGLLVRLVWPAPILPTTFGVGPTALIAIAALGITWSTVGALLVVRRPENPVGRIMVVVGAGLAMSVLTVAVAFAALAEGSPAGREIASTAGALTSLLTPTLMLVFYLGFIFPTGRGHTPQWNSIGRICLLVMIGLAALLIFQPGDVHLLPGIHNPVGFGPDLRLVFGDHVVGGVSVVATVLLLPPLSMSMASRYREAGWIERQQLKWFFLATSLTIGTVVVLYTVATVTQDPIGETPLTVFAVALATVPVAIGIAILRYHLYDIDRLLSRTVGWGLVTGLLVAVFAAMVVGLQAILVDVTQGQTLAVAASTLVAFALFQPVRRRVQAAVDRRFDRSRYDGERTVAAFAERLRDQIDLASLESDIGATVTATLLPTSTGVWIRLAKGDEAG
jgi:MFS family permease